VWRVIGLVLAERTASVHDAVWLVVLAFLLGALWLLFGPRPSHVGAAVAVVLAILVAIFLL
jgi:hypothetical protein